jgi:nicotinate phosphoribosyltransferase
MAMAGLYGVDKANTKALEIWANQFNGKLSTALTDTYTTEVFLKAFDKDKAQVFKTLRQDSGSPEKWTDQVVTHLRDVLGLNPQDFTALFSDSLNPKRAIEIQRYTEGLIKAVFGIGTNWTNDVGRKPLNMVIKMRWIMRTLGEQKVQVVKLSDDQGKTSGDQETTQQTMKKLGLVYQA